MDESEITHGSGNVFDDLGFSDAEERKTKARLAFQVAETIRRRSLTQTEAAELLRIGQPKISALMNAKLDGFSIERLTCFLTTLDQDVESVIPEKPKPRINTIRQ